MFINPLDTNGKICKELRGKGRRFQLEDFFFFLHLEGQVGLFIPLDEVDRIGSLHQDCGRPSNIQGLLVGDRLVPSGLNCKTMIPKR